MPGVTGLAQDEATSALKAKGFNVTVVPRTVHDPHQGGIVLAQSLSAGTKVLSGATVVITVGNYEKGKPTPSPNPSPPITGTPTPKPKHTHKPHHSQSK